MEADWCFGNIGQGFRTLALIPRECVGTRERKIVPRRWGHVVRRMGIAPSAFGRTELRFGSGCAAPEIFRSAVSCRNDNLPPSAEVLNKPRPSSEGTRLNSWPWIPSSDSVSYSFLCFVSYVICLFLFGLPNLFTVYKVDYFDSEST